MSVFFMLFVMPIASLTLILWSFKALKHTVTVGGLMLAIFVSIIPFFNLICAASCTVVWALENRTLMKFFNKKVL